MLTEGIRTPENVLPDSVTPTDSRQPVAHQATVPVKDMQAGRLQQRPQRSKATLVIPIES